MSSSESDRIEPTKVRSPAKINLLLAVTGRRPDGFHELISLVCPLAFGDEVAVRALPPSAQADRLIVEGPAAEGVPLDADNLVLRATALLRDRGGSRCCFEIRLFKRIPAQSGLGGGSSNAAAVLQAANRAAGGLMPANELPALAAEIGSDCPLFLAGGPAVMRGRGERVEPAGPAWMGASTSWPVLLFRPFFGIETAWAYRALAKGEGGYVQPNDAEKHLKQLLSVRSGPDRFLFNNLEGVVFHKFRAYSVLFPALREKFGVHPLLSGSGSTCFILCPQKQKIPGLKAAIRSALGEGVFMVETALTGI